MNVLSIVPTGVVLFMMTFKPLETSVGMETNLPIVVWENPLLNTIFYQLFYQPINSCTSGSHYLDSHGVIQWKKYNNYLLYSKQVDILISKNQALQVLYLKPIYVYKWNLTNQPFYVAPYCLNSGYTSFFIHIN